MDSGGKPSTSQMVVLATSSALAAFFYSIYRSKAMTVTRLKAARKVSIEQDLKGLLSETPGRCVPYAVIEGVVRSVKETLNSQFVENCKGVIERLTLKEEKMVWNRTTHICCPTNRLSRVTGLVILGRCRDDGGVVHHAMRIQINSYKDTTEALNSLGHHRSKGSVDNGTEQPHRRADTWDTAGQRTGNTNSRRHAGGWRRTDGGS